MSDLPAAVIERRQLEFFRSTSMDLGNHRGLADRPRRRDSGSESGDERSSRERPRTSGFIPGMGPARRSGGSIDDRMAHGLGGQTAAGVLFHENGGSEHRVPAGVGAGQDCGRIPVLVVAPCGGGLGRITPRLTQHGDVRPSRQRQHDR